MRRSRTDCQSNSPRAVSRFKFPAGRGDSETLNQCAESASLSLRATGSGAAGNTSTRVMVIGMRHQYECQWLFVVPNHLEYSNSEIILISSNLNQRRAGLRLEVSEPRATVQAQHSVSSTVTPSRRQS